MFGQRTFSFRGKYITLTSPTSFIIFKAFWGGETTLRETIDFTQDLNYCYYFFGALRIIRCHLLGTRYLKEKDLPYCLSGKESTCQFRSHNAGSIPGSRRSSGVQRREWQPTPIFLPGKSHGQRNLAGYSPWGRKESDSTE